MRTPPASDTDNIYDYSSPLDFIPSSPEGTPHIEYYGAFYDDSTTDEESAPPPTPAKRAKPAKPARRLCFRCGRTGHFVGSCYAKTHLDGTRLPRGRLSDANPSPPPKKPRPTPGVYALQDSSGRIYVGKSNNKTQRIKQHQDGQGTSFLTPPLTELTLQTLPIPNDLESWERNETLTQMYLKGIDQVRGWMFASASLSPIQKRQAYNQVCEKFDLCRKCGRHTNFANECKARSMAYWAE